MAVLDKPPHYRAFLLRYWEERGQGVVWRFSLEDVHTSQRQGFASLEEMVAFLRAQLLGQAQKPHKNTMKRGER